MNEITDKSEWSKLYEARTIPSGHFLQSWEWGEFQVLLGRKVFRFADGEAVAQVVELPMPFGKKYWLCPKGPVANDERLTTNDEFVEGLKKRAKRAGAVFLRIEPSVEPIELKAKRSHEINPRCTTVLDLSKTEEELLAAMHQKTRYNIRLSEKHKVVTTKYKELNSKKFGDIFGLFEVTAKRDGFHLHPREYYEKLMQLKNIEVFLAECEGKLLAAAIVIFDPSISLGAGGGTATYLHGASSNEMRNVMAPYALHWGITKDAKARGCSSYDLWGISDDPRSGWAGITRFKRGWGGSDICAPGTFDLPLDGFWYSVYKLARRVLINR